MPEAFEWRQSWQTARQKQVVKSTIHLMGSRHAGMPAGAVTIRVRQQPYLSLLLG
jgi:hypothetical protein